MDGLIYKLSRWRSGFFLGQGCAYRYSVGLMNGHSVARNEVELLDSPLVVANVSQEQREWRWLDGRLPASAGARFLHFAPRRVPGSGGRRRWPDVSTYRACVEAAAACARGEVDVVVTHLPSLAARTLAFEEMFRKARPGARRPRAPHHLAFSFNFSRLPNGPKRSVLARLYRSVDRFVVFSSMEKPLYAEFFGIPEERIEFLHWGIRPPQLPEASSGAPVAPKDFVLAVGRTGRDYGVLMRAMARIPRCRALVVASPENLEGLDVPSNVEVRVDIPLAEVLHLMRASRFGVLPLAGGSAPFGHGALVLSMFSTRALIVTRSPSFDDYVKEGESCLSFEPGDDRALADRIEHLWDNPDVADRLARHAHQFASTHCTEAKTAAWFAGYLERVRQALASAARP